MVLRQFGAAVLRLCGQKMVLRQFGAAVLQLCSAAVEG